MSEPTLEEIIVYPIKSLDPYKSKSSTILADGGLQFDREFVMEDAQGQQITAKSDKKVHSIRTRFDPNTYTITIDNQEYDLQNRQQLESTLKKKLGGPIKIRRNQTGGFPDNTVASGPTILSEATIQTVASWFPDITYGEMKRRLRPNLIISNAPPFWEDKLYNKKDQVVQFSIGTTELFGTYPCERCVVPTRNPDTGEETPDFQATFSQNRKATLPDWTNREWYDHYFKLMVNTAVPPNSIQSTVTVGDNISIHDTKPLENLRD